MIRAKARTAAKRQQKELIEKAKRMRDDPALVLPTCDGSHGPCPFLKLVDKLERIASFADDKKKLEKLARRGDLLARAYAGTLLLASAEKAPYLGVVRLRDRDIHYAHRGKTKREKLVGVQYFDDPTLRLLAVADIAARKRLFVFSMESGMVCGGQEGIPPEGYVGEVLRANGYSMRREDGQWVCGHELSGNPVLELSWPKAGLSMRICRRCASKDRNLASALQSRMLFPGKSPPFSVKIYPNFECEGHDGECPLNRLVSPEDGLVNDYLAGSISDSDVIEKHMEDVRERGRDLDERVFALGNHCFGQDMERFLISLHPTKEERTALEVVLNSSEDNVVEKSTTPSKLLLEYWEEYGQEALEGVLGNKQLAKEIFERERNTTDPCNVIRMAVGKLRMRKVSEALPSYSRLPAAAAFADGIVRTYRSRGKSEAVRYIERAKSKDTMVKRVGFAFLLALGEAKGREWQYETVEVDYGHFLEEYARTLLEAEGKEYHEALQELLRASGSTETIGPEKPD